MVGIRFLQTDLYLLVPKVQPNQVFIIPDHAEQWRDCHSQVGPEDVKPTRRFFVKRSRYIAARYLEDGQVYFVYLCLNFYSVPHVTLR